jgi:toxic protein SymE
MAYEKNRTLTVYEQSGNLYKNIPTIMLKEQWLTELGFQTGEYISVSCEDMRMIITKSESKNRQKNVQRMRSLYTYSFAQTKNALRKQNVFRNSFYTW